MVKQCIVCRERHSRSSIYSFHRFPRAEELRRAWVKACALEKATDYDVICSKHFRQCDFDSNAFPLRKLLPNIVPSPTIRSKTVPSTSQTNKRLKLGVPSPALDVRLAHEQAIKAVHCEPVVLSVVNVAESKISNEESLDKGSENDLEKVSEKGDGVEEMETDRLRTVRYIGDLTPEHFSSPTQAKIHLVLVQREMELQRKKMRILRVQKNRLEDRMAVIKDLLESLNEDELISKDVFKLLIKYFKPGTRHTNTESGDD